MKIKFLIILTYIIVFFNSNSLSEENKNILKVGLLAPLTGDYKDLGNSLLYSLQLALDEINDENVQIIPRDTGFQNKKKLNRAIQEMQALGVNVVIGPINNEDFNEIKKYNNMIFISPSNISPEFQNNVISIGVSLESQMITLIKFLKKQKKRR